MCCCLSRRDVPWWQRRCPGVHGGLQGNERRLWGRRLRLEPEKLRRKRPVALLKLTKHVNTKLWTLLIVASALWSQNSDPVRLMLGGCRGSRLGEKSGSFTTSKQDILQSNKWNQHHHNGPVVRLLSHSHALCKPTWHPWYLRHNQNSLKLIWHLILPWRRPLHKYSSVHGL